MSNLPINITFYGSRGAPNPRRVEIFFAEHKLYENQHYQYVGKNIDLKNFNSNEQYKSENFLKSTIFYENGIEIEKDIKEI